MKKFIILGMVAVALYSCQQPAKIGFIDNSTLINDYQEKKDLEAVFTTRIDGFNKRKDSLQKMFNLELKQAQEKAPKVSAKQREELSLQIQQLGERLDQQIKIEQNRISEDSRAQNDTIVNTIKKFVEEYGKKNGYDFIIGKNEITGNLYYGKEQHDLTKEVLEALNKEYASKKK
ncbi:OmpH family outer membrane protein [Kordia zhangzhouensis]|uniref:OmpH family outer membrane protein n=1 Tax=Kordia zhangzhouensis TaxID=1620405 RepID=UPI000629CAC1|nr:OmpH family outer membrane protein [Kordia zhangzhouensis]